MRPHLFLFLAASCASCDVTQADVIVADDTGAGDIRSIDADLDVMMDEGIPGDGDIGVVDRGFARDVEVGASDRSLPHDVEAGDAHPRMTFTFLDGAEGWTYEGAWPVSVTGASQLWLSPESHVVLGNGQSVSEEAGTSAETSLDSETTAGVVVSGPALLWSFTCPPPDTYDTGDTTEWGAGINIIYNGSASQLAPYVGKKIHFVGSYFGGIVYYQIFAQDIDSFGRGVSSWTGFGAGGTTAGTLSGTIDIVSTPFTGLQDSTNYGAKFGLEVNCGNLSGPVTIAMTSITFE